VRKLGIIDDLGNPSFAHKFAVAVGQAVLAWVDPAADLRHPGKGVGTGDSILNVAQNGRGAVDQGISISVPVLHPHDRQNSLRADKKT